MKYAEMAKKADKVGGIESLSPTYFEFDKKGASLVGRFKGRVEVSSSLGEGTYNQYLFETDEGLIKCSLGKATDKEAGALMEIGKVYVVTYQGKVKISGGRQVNKFTVDRINEASIAGEEEGEETPF